MEALAEFGLILNSRQPKISGHWRLGCTLGVGRAGHNFVRFTWVYNITSKLPPELSLRRHKILCDQRIRVKQPLRFFDTVITPVAM